MAYSRIEQAYVDGVVSVEFPDPIIEEPQQEQPMMLADSGQVKSDAQSGFGTIGPIPRNRAQEALGYVGELLTKAGVQLDKVGLDIPVLGRITLKDLTVGESGKVLEDMSYGFMPVEGSGGFISGTTRIKPDAALELLNLAPVVGAAAKVGGKAVVKGATKAVEATKGLPVGMSIKEVGQGVDELGFYSAAQKAVDGIQQPKGTGDQFLKQIEKTPGVKPEEIKWTGLDDFLKSKKTVTKQEVSEYLAANRVEVKEVQLKEYPEGRAYSAYGDEENGFWVSDPDGSRDVAGPFDNIFDAEAQAERMTVKEMDAGPKFSKYTLPGGQNYREVLLTLPDNSKPPTFEQWLDKYTMMTLDQVNADPRLMEIAQNSYKTDVDKLPRVGGFKSGHFDQPNILAHMRVNDRVDADGKKVLFVEEVQSDWHQAGRKKGYKNPDVEKQIADIQKQMSDMAEIRDPVTNQMVNEKEWFALGRKKDELRKQIGEVPDAPFKTTWHELALKRAIQVAAEGGYDRIAFTTGKTQAERYDLSKQVNSIDWKGYNERGASKIVNIMPTEGNLIELPIDSNGVVISRTGGQFAGKSIDEIVGKDIAKQIMDTPDGDLTGKGLAIGGEGMKGFYDQILPKFLDKYAKKWDAKTGMTKIRVATDKQAAEDAQLLNELGVSKDGPNAMAQVHYIDITPKMKESVVTQGQPLFAIGAGGAGAAATQEENK